jgi:hypothetical protein
MALSLGAFAAIPTSTTTQAMSLVAGVSKVSDSTLVLSAAHKKPVHKKKPKKKAGGNGRD